MIKLLLDTDMMTDCDDMAALAMTHNMMDAGECDILCLGTSSKNPFSAPTVSTLNLYHHHNIPIGAPKNGTGYDAPWKSAFLEKVATEFPVEHASNDDFEDALRVYRRTLANAADNEVTLLTIGYSTNIATLLKSGADDISPLTGLELCRRKFSRWVCMQGNFPVDDARDNVNFTRDAPAAYYAMAHFPRPIVHVGREIGHNIFVGENLRHTPAANPTRRAYELHRPAANWDHHTADPSTVLYAVRGEGPYFTLSEKGRIDMKEDCSFRWVNDANGNQHHVIQKMDRAEMAKILDELITRQPQNTRP